MTEQAAQCQDLLENKTSTEDLDAAPDAEESSGPASQSAWKWARPVAVALSVVSASFNAFTGFLIKDYGIDYTDFLIMRSLIKLVIMPTIIVCSGIAFWPKDETAWVKICVLLQGLLNGYIILTFFMTVVFMPLGEAMTILLACPIFTAILARIFLKQRLMFWKVIFGTVLTIGLLLVVQPPFLFGDQQQQQHDNTTGTGNATESSSFQPVERDHLYYVGVGVGLSCAVVGGFYTVILSGPVKDMPSFVLVMYSAFSGLIIAAISRSFNKYTLIFTISSWEDARAIPWLTIFLVGLVAVIGNIAGVKAFQLTDPTTVIVVHQLEIVLGFIFQVFLLNQVSSVAAFIGSGMVLFSVIMFTLEKNLVAKCPRALQKWL